MPVLVNIPYHSPNLVKPFSSHFFQKVYFIATICDFFTYEFIKFFVRTVLLALTQCCPICFVKLQCLHLESFNAFLTVNR